MDRQNSRTYGYNLPHVALETCLASAANGGLRALEINIPRGQVPAKLFPPSRIESLRRQAAECGAALSFHVPFKAGVSELIPHIRKANIKYLLGCIETAAAMDVRLVTFHLGMFYWFPVEQSTRRKAIERFAEYIAGPLQACRDSNVVLAMENVVPLPQWSDFRHLGDSIADFTHIFDMVDSECLGLCLDTGHAHLGDGVTEFIDALGGRFVNVHIHDNTGKDDEHLMLGEGTIDWYSAAAAFQRVGFRGPFISECRNADPVQVAAHLEEFFTTPRP